MEIIIAVIIAVFGWIINHILTIRAQNKNFLNNIINNSRTEITNAIRDYQNWLTDVYSKILSFKFSIVTYEFGMSVDWHQKISDITDQLICEKNAYKWIYCLEEYEILFPETAECRKSLLDRQTKIDDYLMSFVNEFQSSYTEAEELLAFEKRKKTIENALNNNEILFDQIALMEDLRIYLQNFCLHPITGNKIPERKPIDLSFPRIVKDNNGKLKIIGKQKKIKNNKI